MGILKYKKKKKKKKQQSPLVSEISPPFKI